MVFQLPKLFLAAVVLIFPTFVLSIFIVVECQPQHTPAPKNNARIILMSNLRQTFPSATFCVACCKSVPAFFSFFFYMYEFTFILAFYPIVHLCKYLYSSSTGWIWRNSGRLVSHHEILFPFLRSEFLWCGTFSKVHQSTWGSQLHVL